jgi:Zn-dependent peptidase ImmA (M78 family)
MKMMDLIHGKNPADTLVDFLRFACSELNISTLPKIELLNRHVVNSESNSFAAYVPSKKKIILYAKNRHILDILRSLCHELVHYRQDLAGELHATSGETGSDHENEANAVAGQVMRKYGKMHPNLFS